MKRGRTFFTLLGALCLCVCLLAGCAQSNYEPSLGEPALKTPTIGEADTLRVGVNTSNPPLAGMGSDKIIGIDVDIAAAIADNLGLKLSVVDVGSDPAKALKDDTVDIVMGVEADQSLEQVWLSQIYLPTGIALFSMEANAPLPVAGGQDKFGAQASSRSAQAVVTEFGQAALTEMPTVAEAFADLEAGIVNYVAADAVIGEYTATSENIDAHLVGLLKAPTGYVIAVNQSNGILRDTIEEEITTLTKDGIISLIEKKWLGTVLVLAGLPQTPGTPLATTADDATTGEAGEGAVGATSDESDMGTNGSSSATTGDDSTGVTSTDDSEMTDAL